MSLTYVYLCLHLLSQQSSYPLQIPHPRVLQRAENCVVWLAAVRRPPPPPWMMWEVGEGVRGVGREEGRGGGLSLSFPEQNSPSEAASASYGILWQKKIFFRRVHEQLHVQYTYMELVSGDFPCHRRLSLSLLQSRALVLSPSPLCVASTNAISNKVNNIIIAGNWR